MQVWHYTIRQNSKFCPHTLGQCLRITALSCVPSPLRTQCLSVYLLHILYGFLCVLVRKSKYQNSPLSFGFNEQNCSRLQNLETFSESNWSRKAYGCWAQNLLSNPLTSQQPTLDACGKVLAQRARIQLDENTVESQNERRNKNQF